MLFLSIVVQFKKSEWRLFRLLSAKSRKGRISSILDLTVLVLKADSIVDSVLNFVKIEFDLTIQNIILIRIQMLHWDAAQEVYSFSNFENLCSLMLLSSFGRTGFPNHLIHFFKFMVFSSCWKSAQGSPKVIFQVIILCIYVMCRKFS